MKKKLAVTLALTSVLLLASLLALTAYAQEPPMIDESGQIGELGLADPPPAGFSVLYMFSGVANHPISSTRRIATSVHCTNFSSTPIQTQIQLFSQMAGAVYSETISINSNETYTWSTQFTVIYRDITNLNTGIIEQGSGRILADNSQLICTAQVLDPIANPPAFMAKLPLFDRDGNLIGTIRRVYLPVILK